MVKSLWRGVISSIEETAPLYDEVNETISLRRAGKARAYAAQKFMEDNPKLVLDSGVGPGSMSMILLQQHPHSDIVDLDYSSQLLRSFNERTKNYRDRLHFISFVIAHCWTSRSAFDDKYAPAPIDMDPAKASARPAIST